MKREKTLTQIIEDEILFAGKDNSVIIPSKREEDAGYDIYANFEEDYIIINPHETKLIPTGLHSAFSDKYVAILKERGSTGTKGIGQRCGVIDSGFRGEWKVPLTNHNNVNVIIAKDGIVDVEGGYLFAKRVGMVGTTEDIVYPYEKAICQCIMVEVPKLKVKETTLDYIMSIPSERAEGMLGSSKK